MTDESSEPDAGDETGGETNPGEGDGTGGETDPGEGDGTGDETNPGEGDGTGDVTNPGEEDGTGDETNPGEGDGTGDETNPGEGDGTGDVTTPGEGDETGGETDPGEGDETGGETDSGEGDETDGEADPGEGDETDGETDPDEEEESDKLDGKLSAFGSARSGESDFTIDADGKLTAYNGTGGDVTIPDTVKAIGNNVFKGKTNITSVTIPGTVLSIGDGAFSGCSGLVEVNLNEGLQTIGKAAFDGVAFGKKELTGIVNGTLRIPGSVRSIGGAAFRNSAYLETVTFENGTEELVMDSSYDSWSNNGAFKNCKSLKQVTLPDNLKTLPQNTFEGCSSLEEAGFGSDSAVLETIGGWAFKGCSSLRGAAMPASLKTIGEGAFSGCSGLEEVSLNDGLETIGKAAFDGAAFGKQELTGIVNGTLRIPGSVRSIGGAAFRNSAYLETVTFENGTEELVMDSSYDSWSNNGAFKNCKSLKQVTLPDNLKTLPQNTFEGCSSLEEAGFGSDSAVLETIGGWAFKGCSSLRGAAMPASLKTIGEGAFSGCSGLEEVSLNDGLETIGKAAFDGAAFGKQELTGIVNGTLRIPGSVRSIGGAAFRNSAYLETVTFENGTEELVMDSSYDSWSNNGAFKNCKSLKQVTLPDNLKTLPQNTFEGCSSLEEAGFGSDSAVLETIGGWAFKGCSSLRGAAMPASLKTIGEGAFSGCSGLEEVSLNDGLETIGKAAFDGAAFGKQELTGIVNGTLRIPGSVRSIGGAAFRNSAYLETVTFENGTEELVMDSSYDSWSNNGAFKNCKSLKQVILPDQLKTLPQNTFDGCSALEEIEFGIYLESIGNKAFANCSSLQWVYLPESLKTIEAEAFSNCGALEALYIPKTVTTIRDNILNLKNSPKAVIYGVRGSEAENYANKNNIPFREEGELERSVTGISLNRSKITVAGEEALKSTVLLRATVRPSTAQNKRVDFTSDNGDVVTVDAQGKVTIKGYGKANVTATARDDSNGRKTATCEINVLRRWTEEEKESIRQQLQDSNAAKLTVVTNICETVKDISLDCPAELGLKSAEWRLPYSVSTGEETYDVIVEKEGYEKAVVSGITITGITVEGISVSGANKLQNGKSTVLSAEVQTAGGELPEGLYEMKWETPANSGVSLTEDPGQNTVTVRGNANKTATVTGYLLLKKDGKPVDKNNNALKNRQWFSASTKITVTGDAVADRIEIEAVDWNGQKVELASMRELKNITEPVEYQLSAKVYSGEDPLSNPVLQWKSTNPSVAEVKAQGDRATLRVKEKGAAVISVSASKNGGFTKSFRVVVKDSTPRLEETGVTLNLNQIQPSAVVHISPSNGYAIAEESLAVVNADGRETDFTIRRVANKETEYQIGIKDGKNPSGKPKVFLQMKTDAGEQEAHRLPLTITISRQLPKVIVTQENVFNLYEKAAEAQITVKADAEIADIQYIPSAASGPKLVQKESHPEAGYFTVTADGQTSGNYKKTSAKGKLRITFAGYKEGVDYDKAFTVKVNKNLPAVQAVPVNSVLYPGTSETPEYQETELNKTAISFRLKAGQQDITAEEGWHMTLSGNAPAGVEPGSEGQPITVTFDDRAKNSVTLKFVVRNDNWIDQTGVKASCTIKKGTTPEIGFSNSKLILNTEYVLDKYEPVETALCVKNHPERRIVRLLSVEGKDAKSKAVKEEGFSFELKESTLLVGIRSVNPFTAKNGKYTYLVKGMDERGIPVSGSLTVTVTKTPAKATVKQSGSIDLLNREGTQIICKPTVKNYTDTIENVYLYGSYAASFLATCEDGSIVIKAKPGKRLKVKTTYKLFLRIRLSSGVILDSEVKVTPKQNNPKLTLNMQKTVLFEASPGEACGRSIVVEPAKEGGPEISGVELTNGGDTFDYIDEQDGRGTLYVLDTASQKVNKTYKLKLAVRFKDGAVNAAPVYVTVSVNYRK